MASRAKAALPSSGKVAHPDSLQYLAGQPFTEEIGLGPDNLEIPQQAGSPDQRADADDEAVTVPVGDAAKHAATTAATSAAGATAMPASSSV